MAFPWPLGKPLCFYDAVTVFGFVFFNCGQLCVTFVFVEAIVSSGKTEKSPHDQEIKFFAKVSDSLHLTKSLSS